MAEQEKDSRRSVGDIIVRAGAVAAALASIAGLIALVLPDAPARLAATLENVDVDADVSLAEFSTRQEFGDAGRRSATVSQLQPRPKVVLLARRRLPPGASLAQYGEGDPDPPQQAEPEDAPPAEPEPAPPLEPPVEPEAPMEPEAEPEPEAEAEAEAVPEPPLDGLSEVELVEEATRRLPPASLPPGCEYDSGTGPGEPLVRCSDRQALVFMPDGAVEVEEDQDGDPATGSAAVEARALLKVLRETRARPVAGGRTEPLGVTVNFDLTLEGFKGRRAVVRWSLYDAGGDARVPHDWLLNRPALIARADAASDRASGEFWVPLPRQRGPFFVRLSVHDDKGTRLARADSKSFR